MNLPLNGVCIGAGYFSQFHYDAWNEIEGVAIKALCDLDRTKAQETAEKHGIPRYYTDYQEMLEVEQPDFVDIITPPHTHAEICREAAVRGVHIICQKPLAPTLSEGREIVSLAEAHNIRFMMHENWRFQPWYREIKRLLAAQAIGDQLFHLHFRMRMGDGWGEDAYLGRQPYFREMPRLLVYETGVHFLDTFRYLLGEVSSVFARLRKLNPVIAGEDAALIHLTFENGATALLDANRYNEPNYPNPRYTFGEMTLEGNAGSLRLYSDGRITLQPLGKPEITHAYFHEDRGFAGNCVRATQQHFVDGLLHDRPFETSGAEYLKTLAVQEAVYQSDQQGRVVSF